VQIFGAIVRGKKVKKNEGKKELMATEGKEKNDPGVRVGPVSMARAFFLVLREGPGSTGHQVNAIGWQVVTSIFSRGGRGSRLLIGL